MNTIYRKINRQFSSGKLESQFLQEQLKGILEFHKIVTGMIFFVYLFVICLCIQGKNYTGASVLLIMSIVNIGQYAYFKKWPSMKCLNVINIYNLSIASLRVYQAFSQGNNFSANDEYVQGTGYFTLHICLLINPYLTTNMLIMFIIFLMNMFAEWVIDGMIFYPGLAMMFYIMLLLWKFKIDLETKRNLFIQQQEKFKWEYIFKVLIEQPYVMMNFNSYLLKFNFQESNQSAKHLNIKDSETMRGVLRQMTLVNQSKHQREKNLELYIFNLMEDYKTVEKKIFIHKEIVVVLDRKTVYLVKIFPIDQDFSTFLISFSNQSQQDFFRKQQKTIINQQIGFCNVVYEQFQFVEKLEQSLLAKQIKVMNYLGKQKLTLVNYMSLFKTNQNIRSKQLSLKNIIIKINELFPNQKVYVDSTNISTITSDPRIIKQFFFNLFTLLNEDNKKQFFQVKIEKYQNTSNNLIQIEIHSNTVNFKRIIKIHSLKDKQLLMLDLVAIQKKEQLQNLIIKKLLKQVSPSQTLDFRQGFTEDSIQLKCQLYQNLDLYLS